MLCVVPTKIISWQPKKHCMGLEKVYIYMELTLMYSKPLNLYKNNEQITGVFNKSWKGSAKTFVFTVHAFTKLLKGMQVTK